MGKKSAKSQRSEADRIRHAEYVIRAIDAQGIPALCATLPRGRKILSLIADLASPELVLEIKRATRAYSIAAQRAASQAKGTRRAKEATRRTNISATTGSHDLAAETARRAAAAQAHTDRINALRERHPDCPRLADAALAEGLPDDMLRSYLDTADVAYVRRVRAGILQAGDVMHRLGITRYRLDRLDDSGALPHDHRKSLHLLGRGYVNQRIWTLDSVEAYRASN